MNVTRELLMMLTRSGTSFLSISWTVSESDALLEKFTRYFNENVRLTCCVISICTPPPPPSTELSAVAFFAFFFAFFESRKSMVTGSIRDAERDARMMTQRCAFASSFRYHSLPPRPRPLTWRGILLRHPPRSPSLRPRRQHLPLSSPSLSFWPFLASRRRRRPPLLHHLHRPFRNSRIAHVLRRFAS